MNSEELEQSLRTEFESYLKDVFAGMRQEVAQLQEKMDAETAHHKSRLDELFQHFSAQYAPDKELDAGFRESVVEHLRLARDEGARITATAMEQAEAMQREADETAEPQPGISELRDAINDISGKNTQSSILKSLVHQAANFTPRGAFFIIKNEHLVGWRAFGKEGTSDEQTVREVFFPASASTVPGEAVRSLTAVESAFGVFTDDSVYLDKLEFGQPEKMYAVPLVVRGRAVAVLYADNGNNGHEVNIEALETLARVASLTVEVLASGRPAQHEAEDARHFGQGVSTAREAEEVQSFKPVQETAPQSVEEQPSPVSGFVSTPAEDSFAQQDFEVVQPEIAEDSSIAETQPEEAAYEPQAEYQPIEADSNWSGAVETVEVQEDAQYYQPQAEPVAGDDNFSNPPVSEYQFETKNEYQFETNQTTETAQSQFEESQPAYEEASPVSDFGSLEEPAQDVQPPAFESNRFDSAEQFTPQQETFGGFEPQNGKAESFEPEVSEPVSQTQPAKTRFSDRNVDLPIEVGEEERRLHNDARRFARLLVSEIKLYNEQKVKEGREANDLYERLREAIDRSREMYDKRVQPPVASRFDYFHYEIVNTLAEGDENKLGASYPGTAV